MRSLARDLQRQLNDYVYVNKTTCAILRDLKKALAMIAVALQLKMFLEKKLVKHTLNLPCYFN